MERPEEAIIDAEKALRINKKNTKAIVEKGEALYILGHFEKALVQFERGRRIREDKDIRCGIGKCRDVILSTVGTPNKDHHQNAKGVRFGRGEAMGSDMTLRNYQF